MERGGEGGERAHCEHVNVVDRKHGHKDVMKLNLQNISAGAFTPLLSGAVDPVPRKFDS